MLAILKCKLLFMKGLLMVCNVHKNAEDGNEISLVDRPR